jgi:hypothetical protein
MRASETDLRNAWNRWLASHDWDFFVTLTFYDEVTPIGGKRRVNRWLREIERCASTGNFRWVRSGGFGPVPEGFDQSDPHAGLYICHVMLGGTDSFDVEWWKRRWNSIGGSAYIEHFHRKRVVKAIRHMLEDLRPGRNCDLDAQLLDGNR